MSNIEKNKASPTDGPYLRAISLLKQSLEQREVRINEATPRLFFLCGANIRENELSVRRKKIKSFIENNIEGSVVVIAEHFFDNFMRNHRSKDGRKNSLDFEFVLTEISERVLIVLESNSSFCELGAFAHETLREKLLVVNDSKHQSKQSFINTGPLEAITEQFGDDNVLWYDMGPRVDEEDSVASIYLQLEKSIGKNRNTIGSSVEVNPASPQTNIFNVLFVHDLIFFHQRESYKDLVNFVKAIFGDKKSYDKLRHILAILTSLGFIKYEPTNKIIQSLRRKTFLDYGSNQTRIMSGFKVASLRKAMDQ